MNPRMALPRSPVLVVIFTLVLALLLPTGAVAQEVGGATYGDTNQESFNSVYGHGVPQQILALQAQLAQALTAIGQLQTALADERAARLAADAALEEAIQGLGTGFVTQDELDAEIAARIAGDAANEVPQVLKDLGNNYLSIEPGALNGLAGPHVIFTGVNVHIRNGSSLGTYSENGKGNLVIGYNESFSDVVTADRGGSHNLVIGHSHRYSLAGGLLAGTANRASAYAVSVMGAGNTASGSFSSVSGGGQFNTASGTFSSVTGGEGNTASGYASTVGGGQNNTASDPYAVVP